MVRSRSGPSLKKLMILIVVLIATVLVYRIMSSMQLDLLLSKHSNNRVYYEKLYTEVSDEVADWRQRYDDESERAEEHLKNLNKAKIESQRLREENENLKTEVARLKDHLKDNESVEIQ